MKKIIITSVLTFAFHSLSSQIAIGKQTVSSNSVSLEFGSENRGLILPWVTSQNNVTCAVPGTLIFDTSDKKIKVKLANTWFSLNSLTSGVVNTSLQDGETERPAAKVSIGTPSAVPGILVLEDSNKAMILPKLASPHLNIINPESGTIAFDTVKQQLSIFNGTDWEFWN